MLVAASSPDEVLSTCFENCDPSLSQSDTNSKFSEQHIADFDSGEQSSRDSHQNHDCNCPVHSHHCCSHITLASFPHPKPYLVPLSLNSLRHFYVEAFLTEPTVDGLLRPPIA